MATLDLEQLMEAPNLPQLIRQAEQALRDEARRRQEFYAWLKEDVKAEFINGQVVRHFPVKERHWTTVGNLYRLLSLYALKHKLGRVASEKALISLTRNDAAHNVQEYWIVDPRRQVIEQYLLDKDLQAFALENTTRIQHEIESKTISGFRLPVLAAFEENAGNEALTNILTH